MVIRWLMRLCFLLTGVGDAYRYSSLRTQKGAYSEIEEDDQE